MSSESSHHSTQPSDIVRISNPVISVANLGKCYVLGERQSEKGHLRHRIEDAIRAPIEWVRTGRRKEKSPKSNFWALKDVSFEIGQGEVVGIIGRNGAGKSTLLKVLSRITVPTEGRIRIVGRVASLLEVGTGFHPELTGRENIFLNGAILGMTRAEITSKFEEIVDFSEIEQFLDTPVKRYSSGMYVRLAFAVAAHLEPEILIVDEVLAVGDAAFQRKCLGKMGSFAQSGKTVLFVSHNMEAIRSMCSRGIWLRNGRLHADGKVDDIVQAYYTSVADAASLTNVNPKYCLDILRVTLKNDRGEPTTQFLPGEDMFVEISFNARKPLNQPYFALGILGTNGSCFTANMLLDGYRPQTLEGEGSIVCRFKSIPLLPQSYVVKMIIRTSNITELILEYQDVASFSVVGDLAEYGFRGDYTTYAGRSTPMIVPYEWHLPDGTIASVSLNRPGA